MFQGVMLELDDEMLSGHEEQRDSLQEIIYNAKLNEGYLALARDIEVMEPKSPEDIYKVLDDSAANFFNYFIEGPSQKQD